MRVLKWAMVSKDQDQAVIPVNAVVYPIFDYEEKMSRFGYDRPTTRSFIKMHQMLTVPRKENVTPRTKYLWYFRRSSLSIFSISHPSDYSNIGFVPLHISVSDHLIGFCVLESVIYYP